VQEASLDALRTAHAEGRRRRLQDLRPDLPVAFVASVERAIAVRPEDRHPTAAALQADLARVDDSARRGAPDAPASPSPATTSWRSGSRRWLLGLGVAAALGVLTWRGPRVPSVHTMAVLPFDDLTGGAPWGPLASGIADDVARALQRRKGLSVRGRESVRALGNGGGQAAVRLGVAYLLRGSLSAAGPETVLDVRLEDAETGREEWRREYRGPIDDLPRLQARVADDVARRMSGGGPAPAAASGGPAPALKAYEAYHSGRVWALQRNREALEKSALHYREALRLAPGYAHAWAGLADATLLLGVPAFGGLEPRAARSEAGQAALRALELDPGLAEAQTSLAFVSFFFDWNWRAAEERFQRALVLNPDYALAHHWYSDYLGAMGRFHEARQQIDRARELEPLSPIVNRDVAWLRFASRDYAGAVAHLRRLLAEDPRYVPARSLLGRVLVQAGDAAAGRRELEAVRGELPARTASLFLAEAFAAEGDRAAATALLEEAIAESASGYLSPFYVALVHVRLGDFERALDWLERGEREQDTTMVNVRSDPRLQPLAGQARYRALLRRMNFVS
jgi:TolB-like protein/Tfp pilus assembly protein PilF